jgi:hypothetical protein
LEASRRLELSRRRPRPSLLLAAIVGTVKLTAFLIRKLVTAGKPQP